MNRFRFLLFSVFLFPAWMQMPMAVAKGAAETSAETSVETGFRNYFALELEGNASYYLFALTPEAYRASMTRDGRDLRIVDTTGNPVPYTFGGAIETAEEMPEKPFLRPVPWFPLPHAQNGKSVQDGFIIAADGTLRVRERQDEAEHRSGDIVDLSGIVGKAGGKNNPGLNALFVRIDAATGGAGGTGEYLGTVEVLASNDLQYWSMVTTAQLLRLDHRGQRLERERIDFDGALLAKPPRYLQLRWRAAPPVIAGIEAELLPPRNSASDTDSVQGPPGKRNESRQWQENLPGRILPDGNVVFDTGGVFPVDRLRFRLPRLNTVVPVRLYSRSGENAPWRLVRVETLYRLQGSDGTEQETPEIGIAPNRDRFWKMETESNAQSNTRSNARNNTGSGGGTENFEFGGGTPLLSVSWQPETVTFLARGTPPFLLAVGNPRAMDASIPSARLLAGDRPYLATAKIGAAQPTPANALVIRSDTETLPLEEQTRRYILWGVLLAIVGLLAFMAWKVARHLPQEENGGEDKRH